MKSYKPIIPENEVAIECVRRFEETNLCDNLVCHNIRRGAEVLFDRQWAKRLETCPDYVKVLARVWSMARTNWQHYPAWRRFFKNRRDEVQNIWMNEHDVAVLRTFPKPFTIYRGYNKPLGKMGFSWTLDKAVAAKIPTHPTHYQNENPWIVTAIANPEDVIAYTDSRKEREVIIDPKKILKVLMDEPVTKDDYADQQNLEEKPLTSHTGAKPPEPSLLKQLKCTMIIGSGTQINDCLFRAGHPKQVVIDGRKVKIRCLEIRKESVVLKIPGIKEPQELWLIASERRWKSYQGF